jgi:hypothetical protein
MILAGRRATHGRESARLGEDGRRTGGHPREDGRRQREGGTRPDGGRTTRFRPAGGRRGASWPQARLGQDGWGRRWERRKKERIFFEIFFFTVSVYSY